MFTPFLQGNLRKLKLPNFGKFRWARGKLSLECKGVADSSTDSSLEVPPLFNSHASSVLMRTTCVDRGVDHADDERGEGGLNI